MRIVGLSSLSPRRRLLVLSVVVAGAVLVATLVLARLLDEGLATDRVLAPAQDEPGPVLIVPGYGGNTSGLEPLADRLRSEGRAVTVVRLPGDATGDIAAQADVLEFAVRTALRRAPEASSVDLVGYSAGGVVVRQWVADHDGERRARRIVTLGAPHHGTDLATTAIVLVPGACPVACQQLTPGSSLLRELNDGDETPDGPSWVSLWTTQDQTVTPPETARLDGAVEVALQSVCVDAVVTHAALPRDPLAVGILLDALGAAPVRTPGPADCAALRDRGTA